MLKIQQQKFSKTNISDTDNKFIFKKISKMEIYKIQKIGYKDSYVLVQNDLHKNNIFNITDNIFEILESCEGICFEYRPEVNFSEEINKEFKILINKSIYIIEIIYNILIKFNVSPNFCFFISYINSKLNQYSKMLMLYNRIFKIKERLGKNLNYIVMSNKKVGFGMIDPQGCLISENTKFNFKPIVLKPIINSEEPKKMDYEKYFKNILKNNTQTIKTIKSKDFENIKPQLDSKKIFKEIISSDILSKWISKINQNQGFLFIVPSLYFINEIHFEKLIESSGYKLVKIY